MKNSRRSAPAVTLAAAALLGTFLSGCTPSLPGPTAIARRPEARPVSPPSASLPPIAITQPTSFTNVTRVTPFVLAGSAQVSEGSLVWAVLGADGGTLQQGRIQARCGAPCRGQWRTRVALRGVPIGSYELHVWSPNAEDGGQPRLHDTFVPITVVERIDPDAPAPDALPPGGVPQQP